MTAVPLPATALAASGDHILLASGSTIHAVNTSSSTTSSIPYSSSSTQPHAGAIIRGIAISPDSTHVASIFDDKTLRVYSLDPFTLLSSRTTSKKCSHLTWTPSNDILVSDKVGDTYRYPLTPRPAPEKKLTMTETSTDPSKNPDADLVLGHVSIITCHTLSPDGKRIITSDRDEHIRVSRYPDAFVIDKYLFGSNGCVSAVHIPANRGEVLISGGGENNLRIWDWREGRQTGQVGIWEAVLPHRRARSTMRRLKKPRKAKTEGGEGAGDGFYDAPEGWLLPSGQGVCVKKINSVVVGDETVVIFHSEGAAALQSFVLPADSSSSPSLTTLPLSHPVLDFLPLSNHPGQILVSLDSSFGTVRNNQTVPPFKSPQSLSEDQIAALSKSLAIVQVRAGGQLEVIESDLLAPLQQALNDPSALVPLQTVSSLQLYSNLSLYPRWPGYEEDDELAGTNDDAPTPVDGSSPSKGNSPAPGVAPSEAGTSGFALNAKKEWTREELEQLLPRQLGRLKAQGVDVGNLLSRKRAKRAARERRAAEQGKAGGDASGQEKGIAAQDDGKVQSEQDNDEEGAMNA